MFDVVEDVGKQDEIRVEPEQFVEQSEMIRRVGVRHTGIEHSDPSHRRGRVEPRRENLREPVPGVGDSDAIRE